ncbi:MAG: hypothetical protein NC250_00670 [Alistipes senegalensis]|nr:hypothetical protein [Bacteroides cellulosilyticus]MCM1351233.1 hypothetical protein [Alistipes senegalensis]
MELEFGCVFGYAAKGADCAVYRLADDKGVRLLSIAAAPPLLVVMQDTERFHLRHIAFVELAEAITLILIQGDDAMSVAVHIFTLEKGAFATFAWFYHISTFY